MTYRRMDDDERAFSLQVDWADDDQLSITISGDGSPDDVVAHLLNTVDYIQGLGVQKNPAPPRRKSPLLRFLRWTWKGLWGLIVGRLPRLT